MQNRYNCLVMNMPDSYKKQISIRSSSSYLETVMIIIPRNRVSSGYRQIPFRNIDSNNQFGSYIQQSEHSRQIDDLKIENFIAQDLRHLKHFMEENYNRLIKAIQKFVVKRLEQAYKQTLDQSIKKNGHPIIRIERLPNNKITWETAHTLIKNNSLRKPHERSYTQFLEPQLFQGIENYFIGKLGQKRGQKRISEIQQMFKSFHCQHLEEQVSQAKRRLSRLLHFIHVKITENQDKKIERINQILRSN